MITPLDIQNKEFKKSFRGYDENEVDDFLKKLRESYEKTYRENIEYKDKIEMLSDKMTYYDSMEDTLKETLVIAQGTAADVVKSAERKANIIVEDAEYKARKEESLSKEALRELNGEYEELKRKVFLFKKKYVSFLESQLSDLDSRLDMEGLEENKGNKIESEKDIEA